MAALHPTELLKTGYDGYEIGDPEPLIGLFAEDGVVRFVAEPGTYSFVDTHKGPDGVRDAIAAINEQFEWQSFRCHEIIGEGDLAVGITGGRIKDLQSGRISALNLADFVRFKDGKIVEYVEFFDTAGLKDWCDGKCELTLASMNFANGLTARSGDQAQSNKEKIEAAYAAYQNLDPSVFLSLLADDASYNSLASLTDFSFAGPVYGKAEFERNIGRIAETYELQEYNVAHAVAEGDLVAIHANAKFKHRATGKIVSSEKLDLFRMFDGQIVEFNEFFDTASARQANT